MSTQYYIEVLIVSNNINNYNCMLIFKIKWKVDTHIVCAKLVLDIR